jgi:catechol 2,3-dioxygenase-like lactoylglutathione lyase family enzyme
LGAKIPPRVALRRDALALPTSYGDREQHARWHSHIFGTVREVAAMRIGLISLFVDDQDEAERFYAEVLGLLVKDNVAYTGSERWLTVVSPEEPDGVELALHLADESARAFRQASRELGRPALSLRTDDCQRDAERLKKIGVMFVKEPATMDYGGTDAVFDDTFGNLINLHQD